LPPEPEDYLKDARYTQYAKDAQDFLQANPDSPAAPRVTLDLLTTAAAYQDQDAVVRTRKLLLTAYPNSVQAKFLVGEMSEVSQFNPIIASAADDNFGTMPPGFARNYDDAIRLGVTRFGPAALGSGPGLDRTAIMAKIANDPQVLKAVIDLLNNAGPTAETWRRILIITTDDAKSQLDRLGELHALTDRGVAVPFERYLLNQLSKADRDSLAAVKIEADDLLDAGRLGEALPMLDKIAAAPAGGGGADARVLFWRAWANAATENIPAAVDQLSQLIKTQGSDPWGKEAAQLAPAISALDASLSRNAEAALTASRGLKAGTDVIEGNIDYTRADGQKINLYAGISAGKLLELLAKNGPDVIMGYRATDADASLFAKGDASVSHFTKPAVLPIPIFGIAKVGEDFAFGVNMKFSYSFDDLQAAMSKLLDSEYLSTREGLQDFVRGFARHGVFPLPPATSADGSTVYAWVSPDVTGATFKKVSFTVNSAGAITGVQAGGFTLSGLHYGPAGAFAVSAPALPALPAAEKGAMDMPVLQKALPEFIQIFSPPPPPPATQPAAPPAPPAAAATTGK
jgi:hypothetical protein